MRRGSSCRPASRTRAIHLAGRRAGPGNGPRGGDRPSRSGRLMKTVSAPESRAGLIGRLQRLAPTAVARWGSLTAAEMLRHLGDSLESVLGVRLPPGPTPSGKARPLLKWLILYAPMPWPKGVKTRPGVDPPQQGTRRPRPSSIPLIPPPLLRCLKGVKPRPGVDPHQQGTRPGDFQLDRARAIAGLDQLAAGPPRTLPRVHFMVGPMSQKDWHRWAYKHVDHHLRQFGL